MICVSIVQPTNRAARADLERAALVADLAELRLDYLQEPPDLPFLLNARTCPVIVTNRAARQGGLWPASEVERVALLSEAVSLGNPRRAGIDSRGRGFQSKLRARARSLSGESNGQSQCAGMGRRSTSRLVEVVSLDASSA